MHNKASLIKALSDQLDHLDNELKAECEDLIKPFLEKKDFKQAKKITNNFYKGLEDSFLIGKDLILAKINRLIRENENSEM